MFRPVDWPLPRKDIVVAGYGGPWKRCFVISPATQRLGETGGHILPRFLDCKTAQPALIEFDLEAHVGELFREVNLPLSESNLKELTVLSFPFSFTA